MPRKPKKERDLMWGDGTIRRRTNDRGVEVWQARWWEEGPGVDLVRRAKTFRTELAAIEHLRRIRIDRQAGRYEPESRLTVEQLIAEYMARPARNWKPNTRKTYEIFRDRLILPHVGKRKVAELTAHQLQQWVDRLSRQGLSPSAIANAHSLLSNALKEATRLGVLDRNVAANVKVPARTITEWPTWTRAEIRRLFDAVAEDPFRSAMYHLMVMTGIRPGELRGLRWRDVLIQDGTTLVLVERTATRDEHGQQVIGTSTKTGVDRAIVLPDPAAVQLNRWRKAQIERRLSHPEWIDQDMVFDRGDGAFLSNQTLQSLHRKTINVAGVTKIRLHDIRHTYATLEGSYGTNPKIVSIRMGHSTPDQTLRRYTHVSVDMQKATAEAFARRLLEDPDTTTSALDEPETRLAGETP
jgi:integrase